VHKYATGTILGAAVATKRSPLMRTAHRAEFDYSPRLGYIYVRSRMISSRVNDNFDGFPAEEIAKGYPTFVGKPAFVNHHNEDHRRARGVIIDAALHEDWRPDGGPDTWVEGLHELDALTYPKLAQAILAGKVARTSMGVDVEHSLCSVCANKATTPLEYCQHIPGQKGRTHYRVTASGERKGQLIYESCFGLRFFENSFLVEDPADPTAYVIGTVERGPGLEHLAMTRTASLSGTNGTPRAVSNGPGLVRPSGMSRTAALSKIAHGGTCPVCHGANTISVQASAECFDCEALYPLGAQLKTAAPRHQNPGDHPFFQANPVHHDHIVDHWNQATDDEKESGKRWYADAGLVAHALGSLHQGEHPGGNTHLAAGVIANHSPQNGWEGNLHDAARVLHGGKGIGGPGSGMFASTQQRDADDKMLAGAHHTDVLKSPKVSDFAHLVEHGGDADPSQPHVVVDRHALSVATGKRMSDADYTAFPKSNRHYYEHVVKAYADAAHRISGQEGEDVPGHAVQATTWLVRQRLNQEGERQKAAETGKQNGFDKGREVGRQRQKEKWQNVQQELGIDVKGPGTGYTGSRRGRH
jgi:hypothetical protein